MMALDKFRAFEILQLHMLEILHYIQYLLIIIKTWYRIKIVLSGYLVFVMAQCNKIYF